MKTKIRFNSFGKVISIALTLLLIYSCNTENKVDTAEWRGPNRSGIYNETELFDEWPENGPELLWVSEGIGKGFGAPSILGDKIFVNGEEDSLSFLFAFDLQGKLLWKSPNGKEFMGEGFSSTYPGARSTPTVVNDLVYASSGMGRIACYETFTGAEKWAVDLQKDLGGTNNYFGYSESVIVDEGKVFCFPGGTQANMAALDRFTGEIVWTSEAMKDTFSYCSPIIIDLPERKVLLSHSRHSLFTIDVNTGEALASYNLAGYEYDGEHCNSPVYIDGFVYFIVNDEQGSGAVKLELSPDGKSIKEIWSNTKIRNNFNGYVKVEGNLFTTIKGNWLKALDDADGAVSDSVKVATGSLIYADNKFICYGMTGEINLVNYAQKKLEVTGTFKVDQGTGHHFSHPVLDNGIMYIRHGNALLAYKVGL